MVAGYSLLLPDLKNSNLSFTSINIKDEFLTIHDFSLVTNGLREFSS